MRKFIVLVSALLLVSANQDVWSQVQYSVSDLGSGQAVAINNTGVTLVNVSGESELVYPNGSKLMSNQMYGGAFNNPVTLNDANTIVTGALGDYDYIHFIYSGPHEYDLVGLAPPGNNAVYAINNASYPNVVGVYTKSGNNYVLCYPDLPLSGGTNGMLTGLPGIGYDVNNACQIAIGGGSAEIYDGSTGALTYICAGDALGINNSEQVVGKIAGSSHLFLYDGTVHDLGFAVASCSINDSGRIIGDTSAGSPFIYSNSSMQGLNNLLPLNSGWLLESATDINDLGQICGYGINPSGQTDAFLLTPNPTPEPSSLALLGVGFVGFIAYGRRKRRVVG